VSETDLPRPKEFTLESSTGQDVPSEIAQAETIERSPGRAPELPVTPPTISSLRVGEELGRGAQGVVYRASSADGGEDVAVKVLRPEAGDAEIARFERAIDAMRLLRDVPGVVHVLGRGQSSWGSPFFTMDLVRGRSLRRALDEGGLDPRQLVLVVAEVAWSVHEAHDRGVVHRDLKPENILLEEQPDGWVIPRIADFGLARDVLDANATTESAGAGTPAYMAPEQVRGETATRRTDVWALGAILHEVIAGAPPFRKPTTAALAHAIVEEKLPPLVTFWSDLPESLASVVARALEKDPDARYPTAAALAKDVDRALRGETIGGAPLRLRWRRRDPLARLIETVGNALGTRRAFAFAAVAGFALGVAAGAVVGGTEILAPVRRAPSPRAMRR
jgi:serine/threonine protein kinase